MNKDEISRELVRPILDLMNGSDGGVGFSNLQHSFIPAMLEAESSGDEVAAEMLHIIAKFSKLCDRLLVK